MAKDSSGEAHGPRSRQSRNLQVWLASVAAVVGIATGVFTLRDQIFQSDSGPTEERDVPYFDGVASHLERSEDLLGFLQTHDGDAVRLQAGFQVGLDDFSVDGFGQSSTEPDAPPAVTLYTECTPPLSPEEEEQLDLGVRDQLVIGRCMSDQLVVEGADTDESGIYVIHGQPRLEGYFVVDIGDLHMGVTPIYLTPINFEEAIERS